MRMFFYDGAAQKNADAASAAGTKKFPVRFRSPPRGKYTGKVLFAMKNQNFEIGMSGSSSDFSIDLIRT